MKQKLKCSARVTITGNWVVWSQEESLLKSNVESSGLQIEKDGGVGAWFAFLKRYMWILLGG